MFIAKNENDNKISTENCKACHRNVITSVINVIDESSRLPSEMPLL